MVETRHRVTTIERQIEATDRQIDRLVYELYGLTEEEIAIVEETTGGKPRTNASCFKRCYLVQRTYVLVTSSH